MRRAVCVLAAFALMLAAFAQAAHYHKTDSARGTDTHLQCQLCLHLDRWAGPPELPKASAPVFGLSTPIRSRTTSVTCQENPRCYDARGPPLV
jgi:hypothetical protein